MKSYFRITVILICVIFYIRCTSHNKMEYNLPEPMSAETRAIYMERLEKGKTLYKINCSACHGIFTKGRDSIPNFTKDQIDNYRSAVLMARDKKEPCRGRKNESPAARLYHYVFIPKKTR